MTKFMGIIPNLSEKSYINATVNIDIFITSLLNKNYYVTDKPIRVQNFPEISYCFPHLNFWKRFLSKYDKTNVVF